MRRRLFTVILSVLLLSSFIACSCATNNVVATNNGNEGNPVITEPVVDPQPVVTEPVVEPDLEPTKIVEPEPVEPEPVVEPEDPEPDPNEELTKKYLGVSENWLKNYEGLGLKDGNNLRSVCDAVPIENWNKAQIGYKGDEYISHNAKGDQTGEYIILDDKFVIVRVTKDSDIAWYGSPIGKLQLVPMSLYGYTVTILQDTDICDTLTVYKKSAKEIKDRYIIYPYKNMGVQLLDADGNDVFSSFRQLDHGANYTLKWTENGEEREEKLVASWRYYKPTGEDTITLTGISTDDPKIEKYDFSTVPPGIYYMIESYAFVQVE
ncbi:hypothetical protein IKW73_01660 [Candidatus Saccharibacteria bacterium]|nr:hypothetical protein [Candidatus Saccharibacteria bacterium]